MGACTLHDHKQHVMPVVELVPVVDLVPCEEGPKQLLNCSLWCGDATDLHLKTPKLQVVVWGCNKLACDRSKAAGCGVGMQQTCIGTVRSSFKVAEFAGAAL
eukprot:1140399-Pelagomonas_calceolata.AAC.4